MSDPVNDFYKRHALRQPAAVRMSDTLPQALADAEPDIPPLPAWTQPVSRRSRYSPFISHQRRHHTVRRWCNRFPLLVPVARALF